MKDKDDLLKDKDDQVKQWREAHKLSEESRKIADDQISKLMEQGHTTNVLLASLSRPSRSGGDS